MKDTSAHGGALEKTSGRRRIERSTEHGRPAPRLIIEIAFETRARLRIEAACKEDELRMRDWLRNALVRRASLSAEIVRWLDDLDLREVA